MHRWGCYEVAGLAWVGAFALFAAEYGPMLLAPRRDAAILRRQQG